METNQPALPHAPDEQMREELKTVADALTEELRRRFEDPIKVKKMMAKMDIQTLLKLTFNTLNALKKPGNVMILNKGAQINLSQLNNYAQRMASTLDRKQLRETARQKIRNLPS